MTFQEWWDEYIPLVNRTRGQEWQRAGMSENSVFRIWIAAQKPLLEKINELENELEEWRQNA